MWVVISTPETNAALRSNAVERLLLYREPPGADSNAVVVWCGEGGLAALPYLIRRHSLLDLVHYG